MKLLNFAIIKITLYLIIGIVIAHNFDLEVLSILPFIIVLALALPLILFLEKKRLVKTYGFDIVVLCLFIGIGMLTYTIHDQKKFSNHYSNGDISSNVNESLFKFRVREIIKPSQNFDKYVVDILEVNNQSVSGKALLNVRRDSLSTPLEIGSIFISSSVFQEINKPLNPGQFDYKAYLEKQYVYHQLFIDDKALLRLAQHDQTLFKTAAQIRNKINQKLKLYHFEPDELSLINALLLGQRKDISPEIFQSYSKAGAVHILAVSGLHVGIVLLLLNALFKPISYVKYGKLLKTIVIVAILWSFAIVAGLSASVTRAVMMFSIVAIGMNLKRPSNIYNTLAISMFILLMFKPTFLFDVGFQMSYLAVLAIVTLQPPLVKLWRPKFFPIRKLWEIFTVTVAAQLGVVPISLFYFHQFPGLFFISNLVIIPFLGIILGMGIVVIILAMINLLPIWLAAIYGGIISLMNDFVRWVALQEKFVLTDLSFSSLQLISAYAIIIVVFLFYKKPNFKRVIVALFAVMLFQTVLLYEKHTNSKNELVIFHKSRQTLLGHKEKSTLTVFHDLDSLSTTPFHNIIKSYNIKNAIAEVSEENIENLYHLNDNYLLVVDSAAVFQIPNLQPDYILLRNSPKINLTRFLDSVKPKLIIADGSNYKSYLRRWEESCKKQKVPFHLTSREGAFVWRN